MSEQPAVVDDADEAYEIIKSIARRTVTGSIPAPVIYALVGNLKSAGGYTLAEVLRNMANGLQASLKTHDVYDNGGDAAANADQAAAELKAAAKLAEQIGQHLDAAQTAINQQGYRPRETSGD
ncbi:hypothetical protein [Agromyces sp. GXQ0307]|uniref:hypothetical protein n=1 Tax=unclassified Agromyces TaxID=2639701 RepID=UPI00383B5DA9